MKQRVLNGRETVFALAIDLDAKGPDLRYWITSSMVKFKGFLATTACPDGDGEVCGCGTVDEGRFGLMIVVGGT